MKANTMKPWHIYFFGLFLLSIPILAIAQNKDNTVKSIERLKTPPLGLPPLRTDQYNQVNLKMINLGRELFFEKALSRDGSISCATCHKPEQAFTETGFITSPGFKEQKNRRNTPSLLNVAYYARLHLDGKETSLETQFILPLTAHDEMASPSAGYVATKLGWMPKYQKLFQETFNTPPSVHGMGLALGAYQKTLLSGNSRFDKWHFGGQKNLFTPEQKKGFQLFTGKANCSSCHQIQEKFALFTDQTFHDIGHGWEKNHAKSQKDQDRGRFEITDDPLDLWRFRTPSLRNIALTPPYMHDGAFATLEDVIRFYNKGGAPHKGQDVRIKKLDLTNEEIAALVSFLKTLTGDNLKQLVEESQDR